MGCIVFCFPRNWPGKKLKVSTTLFLLLKLKKMHPDVKYAHFTTVSDSQFQRGSWCSIEPPPCPCFIYILWTCNNLISVRPNYYIFMGYLRKMSKISKSSSLHTPFPEILNPHLFHIILSITKYVFFFSITVMSWAHLDTQSFGWDGFIK